MGKFLIVNQPIKGLKGENMKKAVLIAVAAILVIVIIAGGYGGYQYMVNQPAATPTPTPTSSPSPEETTRLEARDTVMMFIANNHTETQALTEGITWSGGRATPEGLVGAETYIYTGNGWNVTITNPVIPEPTYTVTATYTANGTVVVDWQGTYFHGEVNETSYTYQG